MHRRSAVLSTVTLYSMPKDSPRDLDSTSSSDAADPVGSPARGNGVHVPTEDATVHSEKLWVPLWWWPAGLAIGALLAAEVHMGAPGIRAWLPYLLLLPLPIWALYWLSRMRVEVVRNASGEGEVRAGQAHLPLDVIARAAVVPRTAKSAALGRQLDPLAFVQHRTWVKQMVLIVLDDPDDPTPYWLVSSTRPEELVAALARPTPEDRA